jgi:dTDP-4-amino-4,6-dideoxygalactose transaminase
MDPIVAMAKRHRLAVIEDAAQGIMAGYKGRALGAIGDLGNFSFHETKNIICGEGGALLVNDPLLVSRAEIIREKGTDRERFFRGEVDKYTWQDVGSSFLPSDINAPFLWAQLEEAERITRERISIWQRYHVMLEKLEQRERLRRPIVPEYCQHNGHIYYVPLPPDKDRQSELRELKSRAIQSVFHYIPLHSSPAGGEPTANFR